MLLPSTQQFTDFY